MSYRLDHVGIVVNNIEEAAKLYANKLGLTPWEGGITTVPETGVKMTLLPREGIFIELLEPIDSESRFAKFLSEKGEGLFNLSVFTEDFDAEVSALKKKGVAVQEEEIKSVFPGHTVRLAWVPPEATRGVWFQLIDATSVPQG